MRLLVRWTAYRRVLVAAVALSLLCLVMLSLPLGRTETSKPSEWNVSPAHKKLVHEHVHRVLEAQCRHNSARQHLLAQLPASGHAIQPFLWNNQPLPDDLFLYPPPFGFSGLQRKVEELLRWLPASDSAALPERTSGKCRRCVVVGNGGILKGLELGPLINRFDTIIRLNRGPLGEFSHDVGNRTSIRMSYPEGTPLRWVDTDPQTLFVAVVYKGGDLSWTSAMINKLSVPLWDWLFFWQKVPNEIPLEPQMFRLLNPHIIRLTALDLLKYPKPRPRLWGWDQNVPTLGVSALTLASLLCDEVSLAGFGYNLTHREVPLHYYDRLPMSVMQQQKMHNVDQETLFLRRLVREGAISDLTGGIHCSFCSS
ncbi:lactosylceramide alpha-2,3-sialyltransferase [Melanotaenia boesemani]|uniref:lactosylceramide alpha-2,3-sialyltransferase n=1 Tax=Melanotaenia boesemani TaxID=1250792 RepID=UPI001C046821|nr:lactosylceramide alpha-2,3-sialyltransferase [Melanotaenia boesemani]